MSQDFAYIPEPRETRSNRQVDVVRGQYHEFVLIPLMEHHTRWFDGGPIAIGVEARALGSDPANIIRGPSVHVFDGERRREYLRFDVFGAVPHYHYCLPDKDHNVVWGYDPDVNGPMIPWVIAAIRDRLPTMLRRAGGEELGRLVEEQGWDSSILSDVAKAAAESLKPRDDDVARSKEGFEWMMKWKAVHPQFNTVEEGHY